MWTSGHPTQIPTPTEAHAKVMEIVAKIRSFTKQYMENGGLDDATRLRAGTLRRSLAFRLWMLRSLWYPEPIRIMEIDHWMSRIDDKMTEKLDNLEVFTQTRKTTKTTVDSRGTLTGKEKINCSGQSHGKEEQTMSTLCRDDMWRQRPSPTRRA